MKPLLSSDGSGTTSADCDPTSSCLALRLSLSHSSLEEPVGATQTWCQGGATDDALACQSGLPFQRPGRYIDSDTGSTGAGSPTLVSLRAPRRSRDSETAGKMSTDSSPALTSAAAVTASILPVA